ncbi:MAG: SEC-C domain-containing protein, partial [Candidatus Eremiobacteraeota bacterium]|nr:SEC-C domain-containing protein [Candidatus Eremiobacteraeota bacterium]
RENVEELEKLSKEEMIAKLARDADQMYTDKEDRFVARYRDQLDENGLHEGLRTLERGTMLQIIDRLWIDHLYTMDSLKQGIGLRGWGQKDPRVEYEREAFDLFEDLKASIQEEFLSAMSQGEDFHLVVQQPPQAPPTQNLTEAHPDAAPFEQPQPNGQSRPDGQSRQATVPLDARAARRFDQLHTNRDDAGGPAPTRKAEAKVGRNDPCPCGSGKKYKKCHGANAA